MDAFFASVEQRDNPEYRGKPLAVGGSAARGVVAAASYEARQYGVRSAMASVIAKRKCPQLIFARPRFEVYKSVSQQIRSIFREYTDLIEPLSLDEAYLDVTENKLGIETATEIAQQIKTKIQAKTQLTASAGVSFNKFLAKIASDYNKPNGLFIIKPKVAEAFVEQLEIKKFHGIGRVTAEKMHKMGIKTGLDLKQLSEHDLTRYFGKAGHHYYNICRAIDLRPVEADSLRKSIGAENTFEVDLETRAEIENGIAPILEEVWKRVERNNSFGRTITLKVKFNNFETITRSKSAFEPIHDKYHFEKITEDLLSHIIPPTLPIRLLGLAISNLEHNIWKEGKQLTLSF